MKSSKPVRRNHIRFKPFSIFQHIWTWLKRYRNQICVVVFGGLILMVIEALPSIATYLASAYNYSVSFIRFKYGKSIEIIPLRSLVNNQIHLVVNTDGTVGHFEVYGDNTTFQIQLKVVSLLSDSLTITSMTISGADTPAIVTQLTDTTLKLSPGKILTVAFPEVALYKTKDTLIIPILLSGHMKLVVQSQFGKRDFPIDCVCFSGSILPRGTDIYWAGSDSSCLKYELTDPGGIYKKTKGFTDF